MFVWKTLSQAYKIANTNDVYILALFMVANKTTSSSVLSYIRLRLSFSRTRGAMDNTPALNTQKSLETK